MATSFTHGILSLIILQAISIRLPRIARRLFYCCIFLMATDMKLLQGKVAAITGGLTGIGRAIVIGFMQHGCKVAINHLDGPSDEQALQSLDTELRGSVPRFLTVSGDISRPESGQHLVEVTVRQWGRLDILVSNAGICQFAEFLR